MDRMDMATFPCVCVPALIEAPSLDADATGGLEAGYPAGNRTCRLSQNHGKLRNSVLQALPPALGAALGDPVSLLALEALQACRARLKTLEPGFCRAPGLAQDTLRPARGRARGRKSG